MKSGFATGGALRLATIRFIAASFSARPPSPQHHPATTEG